MPFKVRSSESDAGRQKYITAELSTLNANSIEDEVRDRMYEIE